MHVIAVYLYFYIHKYRLEFGFGFRVSYIIIKSRFNLEHGEGVDSHKDLFFRKIGVNTILYFLILELEKQNNILK